jgi:aspartyl aminopeptidase
VLIIPNLCIHFNREVNNGCAIAKQVDMLPLLGFAKEGSAKSDYILDIVSADAGIAKSEILDYDLFLYESDKGRIMGPNSEFISASRLDNLWMVFTGIKALVNSARTPATKVFAAFDNEEVGSTTIAGANSSLLGDVIARICSVMGLSAEESLITAANSMAVSAACVHAVHPNHGDKHDSANRPVIGKGLTLKYSAAQKYATNARTAAVFAGICKSAGVPYQKFANRSDLAGGTTIGPVMSSLTSIPTVDLGIPILAMHSIREFGCLDDNETTINAISAFFVSQDR